MNKHPALEIPESAFAFTTTIDDALKAIFAAAAEASPEQRASVDAANVIRDAAKMMPDSEDDLPDVAAVTAFAGLYDLTDSLLALGWNEAAKRTAELEVIGIQTEGPGAYAPYLALGQAHMQDGEFFRAKPALLKAAKLAEKYEKEADKGPVYLMLANAFYRIGDRDLAEGFADRAKELDCEEIETFNPGNKHHRRLLTPRQIRADLRVI